MESIKKVMKETSEDFMKKIMMKQFPRLKEKQFEVRSIKKECGQCGEATIPLYEIKIQGESEWREAPIKPAGCIPCENKKMANEALEKHNQMLSDRITNQFWIVPPELENETLKTYTPEDQQQKQALADAVKYFKDLRDGEIYNLFISGSYGGGKSHLLKGIAQAARKLKKKNERGEEMPYTVGFLELENLLEMIKGTFGRRDGETERDIVKKVVELDFLVIDDLGTESNEWAGKKLFEIINGRLGKPTAYSTNYMDLKELADRYKPNGGKIVSRLHNNTKFVELVTEDMRIKKTRG